MQSVVRIRALRITDGDHTHAKRARLARWLAHVPLAFWGVAGRLLTYSLVRPWRWALVAHSFPSLPRLAGWLVPP